MSRTFTKRLDGIVNQTDCDPFAGRKIGIEKESLRVSTEGYLSRRPHPAALGSTLTHPHITTDFSEALVEFVTPALTDVRKVRQFLRHLHQFTYRNLDDEVLWATSMPCMVTDDASIPLAEYGSSNVGLMKNVYRRGLSHRYGRVMQTIAGVHFNFSLPRRFWQLYRELEGASGKLGEFSSAQYFALIRNFQRTGWIVPLLFGCSPAICKSFMRGQPHGFSELGRGTLFEPYATSLRMSDIGYKNKSQEGLGISYDSVDDYVRTLSKATDTPHAEYEDIGVVVDGEYRQLNANLLQIENEYYSFVRPKQIAKSGEKPTHALKRRGVMYVEIRALDVDPFVPEGVAESTMRFMEAYLVRCLFDDSPNVDRDERAEIEHNQRVVAIRGRDPAAKLRRHGGEVSLFDWAHEIVDDVEPICEALDRCSGGSAYNEAFRAVKATLDDPDQLPSARVLQTLRDRDEAFFTFAMRTSKQHHAALVEEKLPRGVQTKLEEEAVESIERQRAVEAADSVSFEEYLASYFARTLESKATAAG